MLPNTRNDLMVISGGAFASLHHAFALAAARPVAAKRISFSRRESVITTTASPFRLRRAGAVVLLHFLQQLGAALTIDRFSYLPEATSD
jgi:hypothetical protein